MSSATSQHPRLDVGLIAPFVDAIRAVFKKMVQVETTVLTPHLKDANDHYNIFGIIGFSGDLRGTVTVCFTTEAADKLVEAFTEEVLAHDSPHYADAIGELANMIAGAAKSKIGFDASITVPSVIIGERCHIASLTDVPCVVIPCTSPMGDFAVEVCIKQRNLARRV